LGGKEMISLSDLQWTNCELDSLELIEENGDFYLHATYIAEDNNGVHKIDIPRVFLPIYRNALKIREVPLADITGFVRWDIMANIGYGEHCINGCGRTAFTVETIEEKYRNSQWLK
jgi:hypothetical protein